MKQHWNDLKIQIQEFLNDYGAVLYGLRNGKEANKFRKEYVRKFNKLQKKMDEFGTFIPDPEAETFELPFESEKFQNSWEDYKNYLYEQFQVIMSQTMERRRVWRLYNIAKKDENKAIEILDYFICSGYKSFFVPSDEQLSGKTPEAETDNQEPEIKFTLKKNTL